jgi:hypothetical protein
MTDFNVGDEFTLLKDVSGTPIGNSYGTATIEEGSTVSLTRTGPSSVWVRGTRARNRGWDSEFVTIPLGIADAAEYLGGVDPNRPIPRKLGEVPEGGIAPDDPRLAWLWEDAGKVATKAGHCKTYDDLCDQLGIPGRERDFTVKRTLKGFEVSKKFKARSKKQAEALFDEEVTGALA